MVERVFEQCAGSVDAVIACAGLASEDNVGLVGQVIYLDGGAEAVNRGDSVW